MSKQLFLGGCFSNSRVENLLFQNIEMFIRATPDLLKCLLYCDKNLQKYFGNYFTNAIVVMCFVDLFV